MNSLPKESGFLKIEFKTSAEKNKDEVEQRLFEIFEKLDLNREKDLNSIEYVIVKTTDFVQKVKLNFVNDKSIGKL
jgi:hypothetical protein